MDIFTHNMTQLLNHYIRMKMQKIITYLILLSIHKYLIVITYTINLKKQTSVVTDSCVGHSSLPSSASYFFIII